MITSVQHFLGKYSIASALKKRREKDIFNFQTAQTMGIVFPATDAWDMNVLDSFIRTAKSHNITVHAIGYVDDKVLHNKYKDSKQAAFLTKNELSFWGFPNSDKYREFTSQKYDILIDFSSFPNIVTSYISAKTNAKMKIARDLDETRNIFDFLIKVDSNIKQQDFFNQITHYLTTINS